jgi:hypothetical protein
MEQILVKQANLHGNTTSLLPADVLSKTAGGYRVKMRGTGKIVEVDKASTMPASRIYGGQPGVTSRAADRMVKRQFPSHLA